MAEAMSLLDLDLPAGDVDLAAKLERFPAGVDLDPRGTTCWWVLLDGEQVGWVRQVVSGRFSGTVAQEVPSGGRFRKVKRDVQRELFDEFDDAVRFVVEGHRG